jgi:release factor glutamine methyltransferase
LKGTVTAVFYQLDFDTEPGVVFVPRVATERLVEAALARIGDGPARVADVGTGSGAIAVALAATAPNVEVWASDTSEAAARLACENARRLGVADRVHARMGDLLDGLPRNLDLVLANLPYLPAADPDPRYDAEPAGSVYAPGDGLEPYRKLLAQAAGHLGPDGAVIVQLHGEILEAERHELTVLAARLETLAAAA